jgi:hypothetical protein
MFDGMKDEVPADPRVVRNIRFPMIFYNEKHVYWH